MNREKLSKFCVLPVWQIEVEKKVNKDRSFHKIFWEWVASDGTRSVAIPKNKVGKWKLLVDVVAADKKTSTYDATETDSAWQKLFEVAQKMGYEEQDSSEECVLDLQNSTVSFSVTRILTDDGYAPELKIILTDKNDFFKTEHMFSLDSVADLETLRDVLNRAIERLGDVKTSG